jgi:hypothetical protein
MTSASAAEISQMAKGQGNNSPSRTPVRNANESQRSGKNYSALPN